MSRELPILFSGPMVRALLAGTKTMTRRIVKPQPPEDKTIGECHYSPSGFALWWKEPPGGCSCVPVSPRYAVGDLLWVKEAWRRADTCTPDGIVYRDGNLLIWFDGNEPPEAKVGIQKYSRDGKWRPSIFMPRWASRITLEVTAVKVERLQEISEEDAKAEGVEKTDWKYSCQPYRNYELKEGWLPGRSFSTAARSFQSLWNSIHGPSAWDLSPWVGAYTLRRAR